MSTNPQALTVLNNDQLVAMKVAKQQNSLARLFQLRPAQIELVSKATRQEGAIPGKFRNTATNAHFDEMRVVILFEPIEQRQLYRKGEYSSDSKLCFSLDNVAPHPKAKDPKAMLCEICEFGDKNWARYREGKAAGLKGEQLSALAPPCKKYWHLFLLDRNTKEPYYFNIKGLSVRPFEDGMQNIARIMSALVNNIKLENAQIEKANATLPDGEKKAPIPLPQSVGDVIWQISFTMYITQPEKGGQFVLALKDFKYMSEADRKEFGGLLQTYIARREAGQVVSQADVEAEAEAAAVETPAINTNTVAEQNAQIVI